MDAIDPQGYGSRHWLYEWWFENDFVLRGEMVEAPNNTEVESATRRYGLLGASRVMPFRKLALGKSAIFDTKGRSFLSG
jgi:hypothetical protein